MLAKTNGQESDQAAIDIAMMQRCIRHSATAAQRSEFPFASLICDGNEMIVETMKSRSMLMSHVTPNWSRSRKRSRSSAERIYQAARCTRTWSPA